MDALGSYLQSRDLGVTAADLVAGAQGRAYMCVKCGQTLRDAARLQPQMDKIATCMTTLDSTEPPQRSTPQVTPTRRRPALPTEEAPDPKRGRRDDVGARSSRTPVLVVPFARTTRRYYLRTPSRRKVMVSLARDRRPGKALLRTRAWPSIVRLVGRAVVKEIRRMNQSSSDFRGTSLDAMCTFSWRSMWQQLRRQSPTLYRLMNTIKTAEGVPTMCLIAGMLMKMHSQKVRLLQSILSLILHRWGVKNKVRLGIVTHKYMVPMFCALQTVFSSK